MPKEQGDGDAGIDFNGNDISSLVFAGVMPISDLLAKTPFLRLDNRDDDTTLKILVCIAIFQCGSFRLFLFRSGH